ncbi:hypothetical protein NBT05_12605 [Aquimarina sp. ERC-38]|uniref:hypothetical protein n=1 Tax=Aquimarina sp. ERC-38 TaxID=2949996 RepID=UPI00224799D1|nr:hypothetical protein [Aquimarina sp. ERC-38]UZO79789.1 hypothetical protein NBT05_12605 [Aquimarina sp. ERC-38]
MKQNINVILCGLIVLLCNKFCYAQQINTSHTNTEDIDIPAERIFMHVNSTFFLPGETIYYKMYCLSNQTKKLSSLSKIAYVELINEDKSILFTQKIKMNNGVGQGDYFIPTSIPSGNYKIIGFTQLSKNFGMDFLFQNDITIINPYQGNQNSLIAKDRDTLNTPIIKGESSTSKELPINYITSENSYASLQISDSTFSKREKVLLKLNSEIDDFQKGNYSISVRKIDTVLTASKPSASLWYSTIKKEKNLTSWQSDMIIPELRGNLISGKIISKDANVKSLDKKHIAVSLPGKAYELKIVNTDEKGSFWVNIENKYDQDEIITQVMGPEKKSFEVAMQFYPKPKVNYDSLQFNQFYLNADMEQMILDRSTQNQIKNGYFSVKRDTIQVNPIDVSPLDGIYDIEYVLDDFTRFPSVPETMIEIIDNVWIGKDNSGNKSFKIRSKDGVNNFNSFPTLVVVDGLLLQDHELLMEYPASKINKVNIIREKFMVGSEIFSGVLEIETFKADFFKSINADYVYTAEIAKPLQDKKYFRQQYPDSLKRTTDRIPDFRNQLLWDPSVSLTEKENTIWFYTSDNEGMFEVDLSGFTATGKPISIQEVFRVR